LSDELNPQIFLGHQLISIKKGAANYKLAFDRGGSSTELDFDIVVIALPFTLLRHVAIDLELPEDKRFIIDHLGYGTNAKVIGGFSGRTWRVSHQANGSIITDNGLQTGWDTSRGQRGGGGIYTNFVGGRRGIEIGNGSADQQMGVILPLLEEIFPGVRNDYIPESAVRMHWPTAPFNRGSYACYTPGQWAYYGVEGRREGNMHFCGEHCSLDFQGYMEGAAQTGADVASVIISDLGLTSLPKSA